MSEFKTKAADFLAQKRIAVAGVSRGGKATGNAIYKALRTRGYEVFPINPTAEQIEGDTAYPSVTAIPDGVDGVLIVTHADKTENVVKDCAEAGVPRVWMHYNALFGKGNSSVSEAAVELCREHGIEVIDGGCPMMFLDFPHKCMRALLGVFGKLPN